MLHTLLCIFLAVVLPLKPKIHDPPVLEEYVSQMTQALQTTLRCQFQVGKGRVWQNVLCY